MANQFLIKETMADMKAISTAEITALQNGTFEGVQLLGYYQKGDTPAPIIYYYVDPTTDRDPGPDDGGSIINIMSGKLVTYFSKYVDIRYFGASPERNDNHIYIQKVIDKYFYVEIPNMSFGIGATIHIRKDNFSMKGCGARSGIRAEGSGFTLVKMAKEDNTSVSFINISYLNFNGVNRSQIGLDITAFQSLFEGIFVQNCRENIRLSGTCVFFRNMWIVNSDIGLNIIEYSPGIISTQVTIEKSNFQGNILGMWNLSTDQTLKTSNVVNLLINETVFEKNGRAFDLIPYSCTIRDSWFELNTNPPLILKSGLQTENNRFDRADQNIVYKESIGFGQYGGSVNISRGGMVDTKIIRLQRYDINANDISDLSLRAVSSRSVSTDNMLAVYKGNNILGTLVSPLGSTNALGNAEMIGKPLIVRHFIIKPDGSVYLGNVGDAIVSVSKTATGTYEIVTKNYDRTTNFIIQVFPRDNAHRWMYHCSSALEVGDTNAYNTYFQKNRVRILCFERTVSGTTFTDQIADAYMYVTMIGDLNILPPSN
ncbi:hypothetical protein [Sphingobacterium sp. HMA12]|uniref:hypothetical protein n=1 Tax=Sphingobacterium sp. HMA12 TaxID=2050894 RepID=UPI000CE9B3D6|nr:hypothetical protein [Sphingobacterium sp. HMA12]